MSENWIEKYNRQHPFDEPDRSSDPTDYDLFIQHGGLDHVRVDTDRAWKTVVSRLKTDKSSQTSWILKVAASVVIILAAGAGVYFNVIDSTDHPITYTSAVTEHSKEIVTLPDGSTVTLARNSVIEYPGESFKSNRTVRFNGEAFFEVASDASHPFTIETKTTRIEVLGTSFGLDTRENVKVMVASGLVSLRTKSDEKNIRSGETAIAQMENGLISIRGTDPNELSWKTGKFEFEDTPLSTVFGYLNKYYEVTFTSTSALKKCKITVQFNQQSPESVTEILSTILNANPTVTDKEVKFSGKGCN